MSATILEALQNANFNAKTGGVAWIIGKNQLDNAVTLLEKGYGLYDEVEPLLEQYGTITNVPEKDSP